MMNKLYCSVIPIFLLITCSMVTCVYTQTVWTQIYGGTGYDFGYSVQEIKDGAYIVVGTTDSFGKGNYDAWLLKLNSSGDSLWTKIFGDSDVDAVYSVKQAYDEGFILTGESRSFSKDNYDLLLIKTSVDGDSSWMRTYGGDNDDLGITVHQTADSGYIILARTLSFDAIYDDLWLVKTKSNGDTSWTKLYRETGWNYPESMQLTADGGYVIAGWSEYLDSELFEPWLLKTDSLGNVSWKQIYPGINAIIYCVQCTGDSGYIMAGKIRITAYNNDLLLMKTDVNGDTVWTKKYGGAAVESASAIKQLTDGGYIVVGETSSFGNGNYDIWMLKLDAQGDTIWTRNYGGIAYEEGNDVEVTSDKGYMIAGCTESLGTGLSDIWLVKTDSLGNTAEYLPPTVIADDFIFPDNYQLFQNCPNPFNAATKICYYLAETAGVLLDIFDLSGRKVKTVINDKMKKGFYTVSWNSQDESGKPVSSGIYIYRLKIVSANTKFVQAKKMLVIK